MRKLIFVTLFVVTCSLAAAQQPGGQDIPNMGRAPQAADGIGRLDARVFDESGNPVRGVSVKLQSINSGDMFCEAWNSTDERGVAVLPAIRMGRLTLVVKAKGYATQKLELQPASLGEPVRVTLVRKK